MLRSLGFFLCVVTSGVEMLPFDVQASGLTDDKAAPNCTLTVTFHGLEIPDGGYVRATSGRLNQVYCNAYCTGPGASPALQFYRNDSRISRLASNRIYSVQTTHDRNAIMNVQDMIESDEGQYYCKGWIIGGGWHKRFFSLLFACPNTQKLCDNTKCIENEKVCDGVVDCQDGKDESKCDTCDEGMFKCDKECKSNTLLCDLYPDCIDGYDEAPETCECEHRCVSGSCITRKMVCDGVPDCDDRDDEENCKPTPEPCEKASCMDGTCIAQTQLCDGSEDCEDLSDEFNCSNADCAVMCSDGYCVHPSEMCDGIKDCDNGADELNCPPPPECATDKFTCGTGECIEGGLECDGYPNCVDMTDEFNCPIEPEDCGVDMFECDDGKCLNKTMLCDYYPDCLDGYDEAAETCAPTPTASTPTPTKETTTPTTETPPPTTQTTTPTTPTTTPPTTTTTEPEDCGVDMFECDDGKCLPKTQLCDYYPDCLDGYDEAAETCVTPTASTPTPTKETTTPTTEAPPTTTQTTTPTTPTTTPPPTTTTGCTSDEFMCRDNKCIRKSQMCDSNPDCLPDHEDEQNCPTKNACPEGTQTC